MTFTFARRLRGTARRLGGERGTALLETALTLPLLLLVAVAIFEFGRAFQTWEVLTNAAREGARVAVLPDSTTAGTEARARAYLDAGALHRQQRHRHRDGDHDSHRRRHGLGEAGAGSTIRFSSWCCSPSRR